MELPVITIMSDTSNKMSKCSSEIRVRARSSLPLLLHPTHSRLKVPAPIRDDSTDMRLAEGMNFATGEIIFPEIAHEKKRSSAMRRTNGSVIRNNSRSRTNEAETGDGNSTGMKTKVNFDETADSPGRETDRSDGSEESVVAAEIRKERGIKRFRAIVRMIKNNLFWTRDLRNRTVDDAYDESLNTFRVTNQSETFSFNLKNFMIANRTYGGLTQVSRKILLLPPEERTDGDLAILREVIKRLKCFERYSPKVKQELARVIHFDVFEDGRQIIKQGYKGLSFYFIVKGGVTIRHSVMDQRSGKKYSQLIGELEAGSSFGELALLHNIERQASYHCKGQSEFIRIDKDDFNEVLRMNYEYEYQRRHDALKHIPAFEKVDSNLLLQFSDQCRMAEAGANKVLVGDTHVRPEFVTFILRGEVKVVREIFVRRQNLPYGRYRDVLKPQHRSTSTATDKPTNTGRHRRRLGIFNFREERHLFTVFRLKRGDYFNAGEDLHHTYIVTDDKVELVHVPRILFTRFGLAEELESLRTLFDATLPSDQEIFGMYKENKRWSNYRRMLTMDVVKRKGISDKAKLTDVPLTLRLQDCINVDE